MKKKENDDLREVEAISKKILDLKLIDQPFVLPDKRWGTFCIKILQDFIEHHNLSKNIPLPSSHMLIHLALSRIFDVMLYSMGEEKRRNIIKELEEYKLSIKYSSEN
jgi:hypothetical protein